MERDDELRDLRDRVAAVEVVQDSQEDRLIAAEQDYLTLTGILEALQPLLNRQREVLGSEITLLRERPRIQEVEHRGVGREQDEELEEGEVVVEEGKGKGKETEGSGGGN